MGIGLAVGLAIQATFDDRPIHIHIGLFLIILNTPFAAIVIIVIIRVFCSSHRHTPLSCLGLNMHHRLSGTHRKRRECQIFMLELFVHIMNGVQ